MQNNIFRFAMRLLCLTDKSKNNKKQTDKNPSRPLLCFKSQLNFLPGYTPDCANLAQRSLVVGRPFSLGKVLVFIKIPFQTIDRIG